MIEDYPSYFYSEIDYKELYYDPSQKWPLIFKFTLE